MQDKKVIVLIILAVLAVASLIYGVTASPKGRAKSAATTAETQVNAAPTQVSVAKSVLPAGRRAKRSQFKAWNRNPFAAIRKASPAAAGLTLNGIIWNNTNPKAMIGDAIVVKGDVIGQQTKVIDVQPDRVILNDGTKDFELKLEK